MRCGVNRRGLPNTLRRADGHIHGDERSDHMIRVLARGALLALLLTGGGVVAQEYDVLIRGGTVHDGSGREGEVLDVGIRGDRIAWIGKGGEATGRTVVDARGLVVAPGFIDSHTHVAMAARIAPRPFLNTQHLTQGVTTIVAGADGLDGPKELKFMFDALVAKGFGTNYSCYVGHNGVRRHVMGLARRAPSAAELEAMRAEIRAGMEMGCVGLSTGLMYEPGMFSDTAEVIELAREVRRFGGIYDSHTRDPVFRMQESEDEAIRIGRAAGIPAKLGHLKAVGLLNRGRIGEVIEMVNAARARGENVVADQYPYDGASTLTLDGLFIVPGLNEPAGGLPAALPRDALLAALADPQQQAAITAATENGINGGFSWVGSVGYGSMRILDAPDDPSIVNEIIESLAKKRKVEPYELIRSLMLRSARPILLTLGSVDEQDVRELMRQPWVMVASDGGYAPPEQRTGGHPRSNGTFTRVLGHYSRDLGLFPLGEAIRRMTSLPADFLGLRDRGRLAAGCIADVVVFDPATVRDNATYLDPNALSSGIRQVFVNGEWALRDGEPTGLAPGRFVPRSDPAASAPCALSGGR
jgi:N-acyl-D-aspartate/D-glutamate deacylase